MGVAARLERLVPDLSAALLRFPVPALYSILLCGWLNIEEIGGSSWDEKIAYAAAAGFLASGAAHFFAEGRGLSRATNLIVALVSGLAATAAAFFTGIFNTSLLFFFGAIVLVLMISPYLRAGAAQGALWLFNLRLWLAALLATLVGIAFGAGLSAIVEALDFLFGVKLPGDMHSHIWITATSLVGPLFGLSLMPRDIDEKIEIEGQQGTLLARGVSVLVNYVLVPVILVYTAILHAYAVKIAIQWQLPDGQLGLMVTIFALGGTGAWLIAWPWREQGTRLLRWFMQGWFWLTIVPAILLTIAVWRRVSDYGVTPDRYGIALVAVWIAVLAAYLAFRRNAADLRAIIGGFAALLLVGSIGPFGANGLTISSQFGRLAALLEGDGVLKDGRIVTPIPALKDEHKSSGNSMLYALREAGGMEKLRPWFEGVEKNPFATSTDDWSAVYAVAGVLGLGDPYLQSDYISLSAAAVLDHNFAGAARLVGPLQAYVANANDAEPREPYARIRDNVLTVGIAGRSWQIAGEAVLASAKAGAVAAGNLQPPIVHEAGPDITLVLEQVYGRTGPKPQLNSARLWVILRQ